SGTSPRTASVDVAPGCASVKDDVPATQASPSRPVAWSTGLPRSVCGSVTDWSAAPSGAGGIGVAVAACASTGAGDGTAATGTGGTAAAADTAWAAASKPTDRTCAPT